MPKVRIRDMVVVLPGICGSVLQRDRSDVWAFSGATAWKALRSFGKSINALQLNGDDPNLDDLGDGVTATAVLPDIVLIPGLIKVNGYSSVVRWITRNFEVVPGSIHDSPDRAANFYEFPYDWRRDNRVAARALQRFVASRLPLWRQHSGAQDAKVVILAHSMGGLVARHYVEVLGGWKHCRALVTFGTPHRGSVKALDLLENGFKKAFIDLKELTRSCTSSYQLLPIYEMLNVDGAWSRVAEVDCLQYVDPQRARDGRAFLLEIDQAVQRNRDESDYHDNFALLPFAGSRQGDTKQSASFRDGTLTVSSEIPPIVPPEWGGGDGTVPMVSATPLEFKLGYYDTFVPERHSCIHLPAVLDPHLRTRLETTQTPDISHIRGRVSADAESAPAISLELDDLYLPGEPVLLRARTLNTEIDPAGMRAVVAPAGRPQEEKRFEFTVEGDAWTVMLVGLTPGVYEMEVRAVRAPTLPKPVHDIFEVGG